MKRKSQEKSEETFKSKSQNCNPRKFYKVHKTHLKKNHNKISPENPKKNIKKKHNRYHKNHEIYKEFQKRPNKILMDIARKIKKKIPENTKDNF